MPTVIDKALRERLAEVTIRDEQRLKRTFDRAASQRDPERRGVAVTKAMAELEQAERRIAARRELVPAEITYPPELPVSERREDLLESLRSNQVVVVAGETGSGKTTQLPKLLLELGRGVRGQIAHTQPRRLAARTVAQRIADELGVELGKQVGYGVRFDDRTSEDTLIRLVTDGLLLAEIQRDPLLRRYDTIIVDEAHERSLNIDFLLGCIHRILPKRPELKLVITSATIDVERFGEHFRSASGPAPTVEVSGRTYPVELRYRPLTLQSRPDEEHEDEVGGDPEERDQDEAIADAVEELLREDAGDVLVFLSGEREIRDAQDTLRGRVPKDVELLPLYARLSTGDQQKVFRQSKTRRVVLATNVAETSLTVPGIRSVVDTGLARISRYSARRKVQRLPIEPISQASANQRSGRCGRVAPGICIRLYPEPDYLERPRYTDPEIQRTNLAAVILQMASLGLGQIEDFPFLDPPDARQIRDGLALLHELGAIEQEALARTPAPGASAPAASGGTPAPSAPPRLALTEADGTPVTSAQPGRRADYALTELGRRLAQLPVDPRLGRMVLEGGERGCASEVIVIAAALSIQDPRERPQEKRGQADQLHARFNGDNSDFLAYLQLWQYVRGLRKEMTGSAMRRRLKGELLHVMRIREWQDLVAQIRDAAKNAGIPLEELGPGGDHTAARAEEIHRALLSGLLSQIGVRDPAKRDYLGPRGTRFQLFPGSALAKKQPNWVMVAELVETSRLFGRTAAQIQPEWTLPLAEHLVRRSYDDPRWDRGRAQVVATERVSLFGLPVVPGRAVPYGRSDPEAARQLFIQRALVEGDWDGRHAFREENVKRIEEVELLEQRTRRRDLLVDDATLAAFFDERVPASAISGRDFDQWWKTARKRDPDLLTYPHQLLIRASAASQLDERDFPPAWKQGELTLPLTYLFEPGNDHDGVTVHVPLAALGQLTPRGFEWLVPGLRLELITALLRSLPKDTRRALVPIPGLAEQVLNGVRPRSGPLADVVAAEVTRVRGVRIDPSMLDLGTLPPHLRPTFAVEDDAGNELARGGSVAELKRTLKPTLQAELSAVASRLERTGLREFPRVGPASAPGTLPKTIALPGTGQSVRAYPTLVDEGETVGVRVVESPLAQQMAMLSGTRRLLLLTIPAPGKAVLRALSPAGQLELTTAPHGNPAAVIEDATRAAVDALMLRAGGPVYSEEAFAALREKVAARLPGATTELVQHVVATLIAARGVQRTLDRLPITKELREAREDVGRQVGRLVHDGFITATGAARLAELPRYLSAARERLERLPTQVAPDRDRMHVILELEQELADRMRLLSGSGLAAGTPQHLIDARWMIEELRVAQLAPGAGTRAQVSAKRVRKLLEGDA